jgi:hypothetical protein
VKAKKKPLPTRRETLRFGPVRIEQIPEWLHGEDITSLNAPPRMMLAEYFEAVEALNRPESRNEFGDAAIDEIIKDAQLLKDALALGDPELIAIRAISLGEHRYRPLAIRATRATAHSAMEFRVRSGTEAQKADARVLALFAKWESATQTQITGLTTAQRVEKCIKLGRVKTARDRKRLRRLLSEGKISAQK